VDRCSLVPAVGMYCRCVRCGRGEGGRVEGREESAAVHLVHVHILGLHVH